MYTQLFENIHGISKNIREVHRIEHNLEDVAPMSDLISTDCTVRATSENVVGLAKKIMLFQLSQ